MIHCGSGSGSDSGSSSGSIHIQHSFSTTKFFFKIFLFHCQYHHCFPESWHLIFDFQTLKQEYGSGSAKAKKLWFLRFRFRLRFHTIATMEMHTYCFTIYIYGAPYANVTCLCPDYASPQPPRHCLVLQCFFFRLLLVLCRYLDLL